MGTARPKRFYNSCHHRSRSSHSEPDYWSCVLGIQESHDIKSVFNQLCGFCNSISLYSLTVGTNTDDGEAMKSLPSRKAEAHLKYRSIKTTPDSTSRT